MKPHHPRMKITHLAPLLLFSAAAVFHLTGQQTPSTIPAQTWENLETIGKLRPRHEAAFVGVKEKMYLLGGRGIKPVDIFDSNSKTWTSGVVSPVEAHHFQPVVVDEKIWLVGAMTGKYPKETALDHIPIYDPAADSWSRGVSLPEDRRRGGAGAVVHEDKLYVVCGIINGHWDGNVNWLDVYDFKTKQWSKLPDAPRERDHFQAVVIDGKIYAAGGRKTSAATKQTFELVIPEVDVFDIAKGTWSTHSAPLPHPRAGTASIAVKNKLIIAGGESMELPTAHAQVHRLDPKVGSWEELAPMARGRHGSGLVFQNGSLYIASGSGNRGGSPELDSIERFSPP